MCLSGVLTLSSRGLNHCRLIDRKPANETFRKWDWVAGSAAPLWVQSLVQNPLFREPVWIRELHSKNLHRIFSRL
ncbi:MAG: hypothetical protein DMG35_13755 [Acidobacteria bacterium]|nr:MAG: hypothetical protein DMG35_13755 [Acidobacteriota bacterium]